MIDNKKMPSRNKFLVQVTDSQGIHFLEATMAEKDPDSLGTVENPDRYEIGIIKKLFERIGHVDKIPESKTSKTPEMILNYESLKIYVECKFIEGRHDVARVREACNQIGECDNTPGTYGVICMVYRVPISIPKFNALKEFEETGIADLLPYEIEHTRLFKQKVSDIIREKRIIVLLFTYPGAELVEAMDSSGWSNYFNFTKSSIDAWIERVK